MRFSGSEVGLALRGTGLIVAIRIAGAAIAYLSHIALARWLGGYQYGIYAYALSWIMVLGFLAPLGLNVVMMRNLPGYLVRRRLGLLAGQIRWAPGAVLLASSGFAAVLSAIVMMFADRLGADHVAPLVLAAVCLPFFALSVLFEAMARGFGWPGIAYGPAYVVRPVLFIAMIAVAAVWGAGLDASLAMTLMLAATIAAAACQGIAILRSIPPAVAAARPRRDAAAWLGAALPFLAIETCYLTVSNADILMLGYFASPEQVGQYFAAARTCAFLGYVSFAVAGQALPKFSEFHARGDRAGLDRYVRTILRWSFVPVALGAMALVIAGRPILAMFGADFIAAYPALLVMLVAILARASTGPVEYLLAMNGHRRAAFAILALSATLNIALNITLIPLLGMVGAALATALAIVFSVTTAALLAWRWLGVRSFIA